MSKAAAVQEPTMEEILASIRRIVSDDEPEAVTVEDDNVLDLTSDMMDAAPAEGPPMEEASMDGSAMEMPMADASDIAVMDDADMSAGDFGDAPMAMEPTPPAPANPAPTRKPDESTTPSDLMSAGASKAVSSAFGNLNHLVMSQNARTLDEIVTEMMRPMLREWLDDNLPPLVEKLVKDEIQRISRAQ